MPRNLVIISSILSLAFAVGCSDDVDDRPPVAGAGGTLEVSWTIGGETDPAACELLGATNFAMAFYDEGFFLTEVEEPCEAFEGRYELYADDYVARSTLVDAADFPVISRIIEDAFLIAPGGVTQLDIDFPSAGEAVPPDAGAPSTDAGAPAEAVGAQ